MTLRVNYADGVDIIYDDDINAWTAAINACYVKPGGGIPSSDMTTAVQTSLGLADSALQAAAIGSSVQAYDADLTTWGGKTAPTGTVVGTSDTQALTNKDMSGTGNSWPTFNQNTTGSAAKLTTARAINGVNFDGSAAITIVPRSGTVASSATPSINTDTVDVYTITALAAAITSFTTGLSGTPVVGQKLMIGIKDNGAARTLAWGASFVSSGVAVLPTTTVLGKQHWVGLMWDGAHWVCLACDPAGY